MKLEVQIPVDIEPHLHRLFVRIIDTINNTASSNDLVKLEKSLSEIEAKLIKPSGGAIPEMDANSTNAELAEAINDIVTILQETKILN